jgi:hypothetical protein
MKSRFCGLLALTFFRLMFAAESPAFLPPGRPELPNLDQRAGTAAGPAPGFDRAAGVNLQAWI